MRFFAHKKVLLSQIGEGLKEATVLEIYPREGQFLKESADFVRVESDKGSAMIPMPFDGYVLKMFHSVGSICQVGEPLALVDSVEKPGSSSHKEPKGHHKDSEKVAEALKNSEEVRGEHQHIVRSTLNHDHRVLASPAVRMMAKRKDIDLLSIPGSGKRKRVLKEDLMALTSTLEVAKPEATPKPSVAFGGSKKVEMSMFEKAMVRTMTQAKSVPLVNLYEQYDITKLIELRESINRSLPKEEKISLLCFFLKGFSRALKEHPRVNSLYFPERESSEVEEHRDHNITVAIDTPHGLAVPNVKKVQELSLTEIAKEVRRLRDLAYAKNLNSKENEGGSVCLTNIGTLTGSYASPLPMPRQVCIVATGAVEKAPVWNHKSKEFTPQSLVNVSFAADSRVLSSEDVARFSLSWKRVLEEPGLLLA